MKNESHFARDNKWQLGMRDKILVPFYYEKVHPGNYELIDPADPRAKGGCDTIIRDKRFDEKIVRWPHNPDKTPAMFSHAHYALETLSCTLPDRESDGWMKTNDVHYLLYCFSDVHERSLDCHQINFPELKSWFWKSLPTARWKVTRTDQDNETECRLVPFGEVKQFVSKRFEVKCDQDQESTAGVRP
jgi:hypothetical protein